MIEIFSENNALLIILVVIAVCFSLSAIALNFFHSSSQKSVQEALLTKIHSLEKQNKILTSGSVGIGQRIAELEKKLRNLQDTQNDICQSDLDFSYTQAQKLIEQGMDANTVATSSGLSESEVSLMQMMNKHQLKERA